MLRFRRQIVLACIDIVATVLAGFLAFVIRYAVDGRLIPPEPVWVYLRALPLVIPLRVLIYYGFGLYRQLWIYASVAELLRIIYAVTAESVVTASIIWLGPHAGYPRSVFAIGWLLEIGALGMIRLTLRLRREWLTRSTVRSDTAKRTLIFGAGDAGAMIAREFQRHPELGGAIVGFIDDDRTKRGLYIAGISVLGNRDDLERLVQLHGITDLLIAMPSVGGNLVREVVEAGRRLGLHLKTLPGIYELIDGRVSVTQIRDVQIEDVLGREEVKVDLEAIAAYLSGEVVLVTGAGGSIGSELCRQVCLFGPKRLLLLGHGENSIYEIDMELRASHPTLDIRPIIADVQDESRIQMVFEAYRPGVVFHAAAHKHVPLMEANPQEAIRNNVFGTLNVASAADRYKAKRFVLISSDKAVNPTSVMGATKRAAECIIHSLARSSSTVFVAVRFGNVLGSRGSVVPLFKRQIAAGGPVTVTDPHMVRYFMTIPEAVQLVIQAASMGKGGETFVLDMGKPVRIVDLAKDMIRLSGFEPEVDIPIKIIGQRPGEKLFEELLTTEEGTVATKHQRIYVTKQNSVSASPMVTFLQSMRELAAAPEITNLQVRQALEVVEEMVETKEPISEVGVRM